jgi:hypothetical protein
VYRLLVIWVLPERPPLVLGQNIPAFAGRRKMTPKSRESIFLVGSRPGLDVELTHL